MQATLPLPEDFIALRQKVAELETLLSRNDSSTAGSLRSSSSNGQTSNGNGSEGTASNPMAVFASPEQQLSSYGSSFLQNMFFLDSNAFEYDRREVRLPRVTIPPSALGAIGSSTSLKDSIEQYFATVHTYFPVISKIRLYQHLANPTHEPGADIALLFLAMKLITNEVPEGKTPQTQEYQDVKAFYNYVESQDGFTIQMIQALLLISLYEIGQCIYPAAYISVGRAARVGYALGLQEWDVPQMLARPTTWTEQEERRRVWWGVIILDRFINLGHRKKPFATLDPCLDTYLPTDDGSWDRGQILVAAPLALSASQTTKAAPFARTCQASHLMGKVVRHLDDRQLPMDFRIDEALQLHRTARALADVLAEEAERDDPTKQPTLCSSIAICYSALLTLYDGYSCTERSIQDAPESRLVLQKACIEGLDAVSAQAFHFARRVRTFVDRASLGQLSPLVIDSLYQCAANCMFSCYLLSFSY